MEKAKHSMVFESEVDGEGNVRFSRPVAVDLHLKKGARVTVRIIGGVLSPALTSRGVTDDEVERIGTVQLEEREQVSTFLESEGILFRNRDFRRRAARRTA